MRRQMIPPTLALASWLCGLGSALAATDPLDLYFNNVLEHHHDDGQNHRFFLNRDHTFAMMSDGKLFAGGTWTYTPETNVLCTTITTPNPPPPPAGQKPTDPRCSPAETGHEVGVSWEQVMGNGQKERLVFVPRP